MLLSRAGVAGGVVALLAAAVTGCSAASHDAAAKPVAPAADVAAASAAHHQQRTHQSAPVDAKVAKGSDAEQRNVAAVAPASHARAGHASSPTTSDGAGLRGSSTYVWHLRAVVTPACVVAGETATLKVRTAANAALAYVAFYAGGKSGAVPPFGQGYGGNADGYSNDSGQWASTWTIRADAPRGPAKVTVVAGSHQTTKQVDVPFTVVDPVTGQC